MVAAHKTARRRRHRARQPTSPPSWQPARRRRVAAPAGSRPGRPVHRPARPDPARCRRAPARTCRRRPAEWTQAREARTRDRGLEAEAPSRAAAQPQGRAASAALKAEASALAELTARPLTIRTRTEDARGQAEDALARPDGANIDKIAELFPTVVTESLDDEGKPGAGDRLRPAAPGALRPRRRGAAGAIPARLARQARGAVRGERADRQDPRPVREESVDFDTTQNLFIEGDNLDALKLLQESYLGKVKLIYIDPPYNTGNDFVYADDFARDDRASTSRSRDRARTTATNSSRTPSANGRFHSDWLSMMYPRLKLARNLLTDDGVWSVISIDENESRNLRGCRTEVFGAGCLRRRDRAEEQQ